MSENLAAPGESRDRVLAFVREYHAEHGYAPTLDEIGIAVGFKSKNTVHYHLRALERNGQLRHVVNVSRGLVLNDLRPAGRTKPIQPAKNRCQRRQQVLDFIRRHLEVHGYAPSMREIATGIGTTLNAVERDIHALVTEGRIEQLRNCARSLKLIGGA